MKNAWRWPIATCLNWMPAGFPSEQRRCNALSFSLLLDDHLLLVPLFCFVTFGGASLWTMDYYDELPTLEGTKGGEQDACHRSSEVKERLNMIISRKHAHQAGINVSATSSCVSSWILFHFLDCCYPQPGGGMVYSYRGTHIPQNHPHTSTQET